MDGLGNHENEVVILTSSQLEHWLYEAEKLSPAHVSAIKEQNKRQLNNLFIGPSNEII